MQTTVPRGLAQHPGALLRSVPQHQRGGAARIGERGARGCPGRHRQRRPINSIGRPSTARARAQAAGEIHSLAHLYPAMIVLPLNERPLTRGARSMTEPCRAHPTRSAQLHACTACMHCMHVLPPSMLVFSSSAWSSPLRAQACSSPLQSPTSALPTLSSQRINLSSHVLHAGRRQPSAGPSHVDQRHQRRGRRRRR